MIFINAVSKEGFFSYTANIKNLGYFIVLCLKRGISFHGEDKD